MPSIGSVVHIYNEEMLLPFWIKHHLPLYEKMIFIDHRCTDNSLDIIRELAPEALVLPTRLADFNAGQVDHEVMEVEARYLNTDWKICSNITEFMWCKDLQEVLSELPEEIRALKFHAYMMVDNQSSPLEGSLWKDRTHGYLDDGSALNSRRARFIHREQHGAYGLGRHNTAHLSSGDSTHNILFASFSPWPQAINRKLQVQTQIPISDKQAGSGIQHIQNPETLNNFYHSELIKSTDLLLDSNFKRNYDYYMSLGDN